MRTMTNRKFHGRIRAAHGEHADTWHAEPAVQGNGFGLLAGMRFHGAEQGVAVLIRIFPGEVVNIEVRHRVTRSAR